MIPASLLRIPDEHLDLRATLREFLTREVRPIEDVHRQETQSGRFDGLKQEVARVRRRSAELGFWALHMPEEVGGAGLSCLGQVLLHEEAHRQGMMLARWEAFLPGVTGPSLLYMACSEEQRSRYLSPLMSAEKAACFALTEPEAGSDVSRIRTRAERTPAGWLLNGQKQFITAASEADFALVFAVTDAEKGIREGSPPSSSTRRHRASASSVPRQRSRRGRRRRSSCWTTSSSATSRSSERWDSPFRPRSATSTRTA